MLQRYRFDSCLTHCKVTRMILQSLFAFFVLIEPPCSPNFYLLNQFIDYNNTMPKPKCIQVCGEKGAKRYIASMNM